MNHLLKKPNIKLILNHINKNFYYLLSTYINDS